MPFGILNDQNLDSRGQKLRKPANILKKSFPAKTSTCNNFLIVADKQKLLIDYHSVIRVGKLIGDVTFAVRRPLTVRIVFPL